MVPPAEPDDPAEPRETPSRRLIDALIVATVVLALLSVVGLTVSEYTDAQDAVAVLNVVLAPIAGIGLAAFGISYVATTAARAGEAQASAAAGETREARRETTDVKRQADALLADARELADALPRMVQSLERAGFSPPGEDTLYFDVTQVHWDVRGSVPTAPTEALEIAPSELRTLTALADRLRGGLERLSQR